MKSRKGFAYLPLLGIIVVAVAVYMIFSGPAPHTPFAGQADLKTFATEEEVRNFIKSNAQQGYGLYGATETFSIQRSDVQTGAEAPKALATDYSATNIQVAGVDESDFVKNDGKHIYTISGGSVNIVDAFPADGMKIVSTINLSSENPHRIYVNGNRLVVFGTFYSSYTRPLEKEIAGAAVGQGMIAPYYNYPNTHIKIYDISDRSNPVLKRDLRFNGTYHDSRMIGDYIYTIINSPAYYFGRDMIIPAFSPEQRAFPAIYYFDVPDYSYQFTNIVSVNVNDDGRNIENKVFLLGYSNTLFVSQENIYMVYQKRLSPSYILDRILDEVIIPAAPSGVSTEIREIRNSDRPAYEKQAEISAVLQRWFEDAGPEDAAKLQKSFGEKYQQIQEELAKELQKSVVHKISISNGKIDYRTKGEIPGYPLNQFSMDEHNGYFRIATTVEPFFGVSAFGAAESRDAIGAAQQIAMVDVVQATEELPVDEPDEPVRPAPVPEPSPREMMPPPQRQTSTNNVYVLDRDMNIVGRLENLAPGERIFSARFMGNRAYLVTFVRIDPLFVIDLSNPANPKVLGELKIPGVSDYLHPYDENHIIGVGRSTDDIQGRVAFKGLKISLFDVTDVANPKEMSKYEIGDRGTSSDALYDHKAFLFSRQKNLLVLPMTVYERKPGEFYGSPVFQGAHVFDITLDKGLLLKGRITHYENAPKNYYYGPYSITRSLYMDENLYTISGAAIKANKLSDLSEIKKVDLPVQQGGIFYPMGIAEIR